MRVTYNSHILTLLSVTNGPLTAGFGLEYLDGTGYVDIVLSSATNLPAGSGILAYLDFQVDGAADVGALSEVSVARNDLGDQYGGDLNWSSGVSSSCGSL